MAARNLDHSTHLVEGPDGKLLPVAVIFGSHGSGKTNLFRGLLTMASNVIDPGSAIYPQPFLLDNETAGEPTFFQVALTIGKGEAAREYNYGYKMMQDGTVIEEWLYIVSDDDKWKMQKIFDRNTIIKAFEVDHLASPAKEWLEDLDLPDKRLVLSLEKIREIPDITAVYDWFSGLFFMRKEEDVLWTAEELTRFLKEHPEEKEGLVAFLRGCGLELETIVSDQKGGFLVRYGEGKCLPLAAESAGFFKLSRLYFLMKECFERGGVLFVDDLDLHPLVLRNLIITFADQGVNSNHAQLIFSTQNVWLLSGDILRDDEIWFVGREEDYCSELYSLVEFKNLKEGRGHMRDYLLGRYGAIPKLQRLFAENKG